MNEAVLQVLLILAYLAIGLMSVTFPIYAISVNFLPQQKWESEKERGKRKHDLLAKITELTTKLGMQTGETAQVTQIREELDKYEAELQGTELRYQYLTAKGAVLVPVSGLIVALLFAILGIYGFYKDSREAAILLGIVSAMFSAGAIFRLYKTISAVEYGALRPERTVEFDVGFEHYEKTVKTKLNQKRELGMFIKTLEYDIEKSVVLAIFPSDLGVEAEYEDPQLLFTKYEKRTCIMMFTDYLARDMAVGFPFDVVPTKVGKYPVTVRICAKGIHEVRKELTIEVE